MAVRDSPRWCAKCTGYGDHHTEKHEEMLIADLREQVQTLEYQVSELWDRLTDLTNGTEYQRD